MTTLPDLVLYLDTNVTRRIQKNTGTQNEIWIEYDFLFPQQYITDGYDWDVISFFQTSTAFSNNFVEGWRAALSGSFWHEDWNGGITWSHTSPGDVWNHFKMHYLKGVGNGSDGLVEAYHNGTLMEDVGSDHNDYVGLPVMAVSLHQDTGGAPVYIKNIKIGTTDGGTEILSENFSTRDFSQWDVNSSGLLVPDPLGSIPLSLTPITVDEHINGITVDTATEQLALTPSAIFVEGYDDIGTEALVLKPSASETGPWSDSGIELFKFTPSTDEHYCPEKVSVEGDLTSRWEAASGVKWPASMTSRWEAQFLGIGEGFAC